MDGHEWPYLVRGNTTEPQANMTSSDEPGIYIRGEFGVRLEDDMHITENGAELFTPQSLSLVAFRDLDLGPRASGPRTSGMPTEFRCRV